LQGGDTAHVTGAADSIMSAACEALGPCRRVADLSWSHGESSVVELQTADGEHVIAKAYRQAARFAAESAAYEQWVPSLGANAPTVLARDAGRQVLIMTKVAGSPMGDGQQLSVEATVDAHRQAGALLAKFHSAAPAVVIESYVDAQRARMASWLARDVDGVLDDADVSFAAEQLNALAALPDPVGVPCHQDWQPRNWLIDDRGALSVIDFEVSRIGPWFEDLQRLWWNEWMQDRRLADAFFAGYGHHLTDVEMTMLGAISPLGHLIVIVWAHEHHDEVYGTHARRCIAQARKQADRGQP